MGQNNRVLITFVEARPSSFDIGDLNAGRCHLIGYWEREMEGILKVDWWGGFGERFGGVENKVINS